MIEFYVKQTVWSCPGEYSDSYHFLPDNLPQLRRFIAQFFIHYIDMHASNLFHYKANFFQYNLRSIKEKFSASIVDHKDLAIYFKNKCTGQLLGVCRDNALLLCSVLRSRGVSARLRAGFASYIIKGYFLDGVCVEYYNKQYNKWCFIDPRTLYVDGLSSDDFIFESLSSDQFIPANRAWHFFRDGKFNSSLFGSRFNSGIGALRNALLRDFAYLNGIELLLWDLWGDMLNPSLDFDKYDRLSSFISYYSYDIEKIFSFYHDHVFYQVHNPILVCFPLSKTVKKEVVSEI